MLSCPSIIHSQFFAKRLKGFPDPALKVKAQLDLATLQQNGELQRMAMDAGLAQGQLDINKIEAANPRLLVSGWRPALGWVCVLGLAMQFVVGPFATWGASLASKTIVFPVLDLGTLMTLLFGMLGLGGLRSYEKINGVASK